MTRQRAQRRPHVLHRLRRMARMPADRSVHTGKPLGQLHRLHAALEIRADGNDSHNARRLGALDHLGQVLGEVGKIQVSVSVVKNRHSQLFAVGCLLLCGHHLASAAGNSQSAICIGCFPIDFCGRAR